MSMEALAENLKGDEQQYVAFQLGKEIYGIDIKIVSEIITIQTITQVPRTQEFIEGIINLRGYVIPVFNLRKKFNLPEEDVTRSSRIIVVEISGNTLGIIVDAVSEVLQISSDMIEPPSRVISGFETEYLKGVAKLENQLVIILDLEKVIIGQEKFETNIQ